MGLETTMRKMFVLLLVLWAGSLRAQEISNIRVQQEGKTVVILYDLTGESGVKYSITVLVSDDGGKTFAIKPKSLSGDAGAGVLPGKSRKIVWDVLKDVDKLAGSDFVFKIRGSGPGGVFGIELVFVKGGTFQMGSNDGDSDEKPVHTVTVDDFYIGKYEVTQKQWRDVMGTSPSYNKNCDQCPVEKVSWNDVKEFLKKLNQKTGKSYRLPYEAEWEYAARSGGKDEKWAGTNSSLEQYAWYSFNSGGKTHPVGTKKPNGLGIYDMTGNVWEWCEDWYADDYYSRSPKNNPKGPSSGSGRVTRGGSRGNLPYHCWATDRSRSNPDSRDKHRGFRICLPVP